MAKRKKKKGAAGAEDGGGGGAGEMPPIGSSNQRDEGAGNDSNMPWADSKTGAIKIS